MSFESLNEDILYEIFQYLDFKSLRNLSQLSESIYRNAQNTLIRKLCSEVEEQYHRTFGNFKYRIEHKTDFENQVFVKMTTEGTYLVTFYLRKEKSYHQEIVENILEGRRYTKYLKKLSLVNIRRFEDLKIFSEMYSTCEELALVFHKDYQSSSFPLHKEKLFPSLKMLMVSHDLVPKELLPHFGDIEHLRMFWSFDEDLIKQNSKTLKTLCIYGILSGSLDFCIESQITILKVHLGNCKISKFLENQHELEELYCESFDGDIDEDAIRARNPNLKKCCICNVVD